MKIPTQREISVSNFKALSLLTTTPWGLETDKMNSERMSKKKEIKCKKKKEKKGHPWYNKP